MEAEERANGVLQTKVNRRVTEKAEAEVRGVQFSCAEMRTIWEKCGEELYIPEINDSNTQVREDAYRKAAKLI